MKATELLIIVLNDIIPGIGDSLRIHLELLEKTYPEKIHDRELSDKEANELYRALMQEKEGILNWLVEGAVEAIKEARTGIFKRL